MVTTSGFMLLLQAGVTRDTIVTLTMPAQRTAFDYASGTLQILVLIAGIVVLVAFALTALTLRRSIVALQSVVDRLATDVKPLLHQATRVSEDTREVVTTVRREVDRMADASAEVSERLLDLSDIVEDRIDSVRALADVIQDEVHDTAISAAAAVRGARVGALALGAAFGLAKRGAKGKRSDRRIARGNKGGGVDEELNEEFDEDLNAEFDEELNEELNDELNEELDDELDEDVDEDVDEDFNGAFNEDPDGGFQAELDEEPDDEVDPREERPRRSPSRNR